MVEMMNLFKKISIKVLGVGWVSTAIYLTHNLIKWNDWSKVTFYNWIELAIIAPILIFMFLMGTVVLLKKLD